MRNPIQELQAEELEKEEICRDILNSTRNELYLGMRFLDSALSAPGAGYRSFRGWNRWRAASFLSGSTDEMV